jgi:hypothetical protein
MKLNRFLPIAVVLVLVVLAASARPQDEKKVVKEKSLDAPNGLIIKVRMEGPYDADTPLQIVCYFKHKKSGDKTLGAAVELDKKLGGVIASLRNRGEFVGDGLETLLLAPPKGTIKPKLLLLVGLGDEESLSLERMERVGKVALREAAKLGVKRAAFPRSCGTRGTPSSAPATWSRQSRGACYSPMTRRGVFKKRAWRSRSPWRNGSWRPGRITSMTR